MTTKEMENDRNLNGIGRPVVWLEWRNEEFNERQFQIANQFFYKYTLSFYRIIIKGERKTSSFQKEFFFYFF